MKNKYIRIFSLIILILFSISTIVPIYASSNETGVTEKVEKAPDSKENSLKNEKEKKDKKDKKEETEKEEKKDKKKETEKEEKKTEKRDLVPKEGTVANAFSKDADEAKMQFIKEYGWDYSKAKVRKWESDTTGKKEKFERDAGWQEEFLGDNIETTKQYLGLGSKSGSGTGGGGKSVVKIALAELNKDDSVEAPLGSDKVKYNEWYYGKDVEIDGDKPWSCTFISWCMDQAGLIKNGFWKKMASCEKTYSYCTKTLGFKSYNVTATTPLGGNTYKPVAGDLMFFRENDKWVHAGIIVEVEADGWYTVEGDADNKVKKLYYNKDTFTAAKEGKIVAMEYPKSEYEDGAPEQNKETVFNFLTKEMGYSNAAACGVMANIEKESGFIANINEFSGGGGYGICQWTGGRRTRLVNWCNSNGVDYKALDGQLWFLKHETETYYSNVNNAMLGIKNSAQGAYDAGYTWCKKWEIPADTEGTSRYRGNIARNQYWPAFGK